jgi:glycosyltransferase involved in cell wall biosynthesis
VSARADVTTRIAAAVEAAVARRETGPPAGLAIVMSALDEGESIAEVLDDLPTAVAGLSVVPVVVDDGSSDATAVIAEKAGAVVVRHPRNLGQGEGLRTGFAAARALGADVVVTMDADGQHDPAALPDLVGPVAAGEADYVQGSRFLGQYDDAGGVRHLGIRFFTTLINLLARTRVTDCTNGYRAIRVAELSRMRLVEDRFSASEILIEAAACGLRMREVPVHIRSRHAGESRKPGGIRYPVGYLAVILRSFARARGRRGSRGRRRSPGAGA